jgi:hypothetical protein
MKLVAIARAPERIEDAAAALAAATGLTLAESRMRLAPEPPALVARLEAGPAGALVASLRRAGLSALAIDAQVPTDADRTIGLRVTVGPEGVTIAPRSGDAMQLAWSDLLAVLRGSRESRTEADRTERSKRLSVGMAVATGGLIMTRSSTRNVRSSDSSFQQVILVYARDGRSAALVEGQVDFSCLGADLQPSSTANMNTLSRRFQEQAKGAFHDDRLLRLGRRPLPFVAGNETRSTTSAMVVTRQDTAASLDVLAEVMRQAAGQGLLPHRMP